jgi:ABC-2 type transport system permease protein
MNNLVRAEWIKFSSLRASWTRLGVALALNGLFVAFTLWAFNRSTGDSTPDTSIANRVGTLSAGITMAALVFIVIGINVHTAEIKSRSIIPTAGAAPDRRDLIGAKAALTGAVGLASGAVLMLLTTIACLIVLDARGFPLNPFDDDDAARVIIGSIAYLAIAALFGLGIGIVLNSATSAIAVGILWPLGLEQAFQGFLPDWIDRFLPFEAGKSLIVHGSQHQLTAWEGGGVFLAWSALLVIAGWALFNRRDLSDS